MLTTIENAHQRRWSCFPHYAYKNATGNEQQNQVDVLNQQHDLVAKARLLMSINKCFCARVQHIRKGVGEVSIFCDLNQHRRYAFSVPNEVTKIIKKSFPGVNTNEGHTFYRIIECRERFHTFSLQDIDVSKSFPDRRF